MTDFAIEDYKQWFFFKGVREDRWICELLQTTITENYYYRTISISSFPEDHLASIKYCFPSMKWALLCRL